MFALGFTLGYRTRFCAVATWFLVMSMQVRAGMVLHGGDDLLRVLLFWSMFVPLNGRFSLDRALNPDAKPLPLAHLSPGSLALIFQVCAMYWYTAAEKMHPVWLTERSAVYYALSLELFSTSIGRFLLGFPTLLPVITAATLVLELLGPILALLPVRTGALRLLVVGMFISFHIGIGLTMRLGLFPWVSVSAWFLFLPPEFWGFVGKKLAAIGSRLRALRRLPERLFQPPLRPPAPKQDFGLATSVIVMVCLVLTEAALFQPPDAGSGALRAARGEAHHAHASRIRPGGCSHRTLERDDGWYRHGGRDQGRIASGRLEGRRRSGLRQAGGLRGPLPEQPMAQVSREHSPGRLQQL